MVNRTSIAETQITLKSVKVELLSDPTSLRYIVLIGALLAKKIKPKKTIKFFYRAYLLDNFKTELIAHNFIKILLLAGQTDKALHVLKRALCLNPSSKKSVTIFKESNNWLYRKNEKAIKTQINFEKYKKVYNFTTGGAIDFPDALPRTRQIKNNIIILLNPEDRRTRKLNEKVTDQHVRLHFYSYLVQPDHYSTLSSVMFGEHLKKADDHQNVQRLFRMLSTHEKRKPIYVPILIWLNARQNRYEVIGQIINDFITTQSENENIWNKIGLQIEALKHKKETRKFYQLASQRFPEQCDILHNYAQSEFDLENITVAKSICLRILIIKPHQKKTMNLLGIICGLENLERQALIVLARCLVLRPNWPPALLNIGIQYSNLGNYRAAISYKIKAMRHAERDKAKPAYNLALELIARGRLKIGFNLYRMRWGAEGFNAEKRAFPQPDLVLENRKDVKKLALYTEQGLGDEFMYSWYLSLIEREFPSTVVEVDQRLVQPFQRSFNGLNFVPREYPIKKELVSNSLSHHAALVDMARLYTHELNKEIEKIRCGDVIKFRKNDGWVKADCLKQKMWENYFFKTYGDIKKIGVFWRSDVSTVKRMKHYLTPTILSFGVPEDVLIVNLQYSYKQSEIEQFQKISQSRNISFLNPGDIDLKNDIDDVLALMKSLDLVVGPLISIPWMAAAIGVPSIVLRSERRGYIWQQFGQNFVPWAPSMKLLFRDPNTDWLDTMSKLKYSISENLTFQRN